MEAECHFCGVPRNGTGQLGQTPGRRWPDDGRSNGYGAAASSHVGLTHRASLADRSTQFQLQRDRGRVRPSDRLLEDDLRDVQARKDLVPALRNVVKGQSELLVGSRRKTVLGSHDRRHHTVQLDPVHIEEDAV